MRYNRTPLRLALALGALPCLFGCKKDETVDAAPPPSSNAQGLGNAAGTKPTVGANTGPAGRQAEKPNTK